MDCGWSRGKRFHPQNRCKEESIMAKMQKAIVYKGPGHFAYEDRPIPEIQNKNDVKIKSYGCSICGSDINIFAVPQRHPCAPDRYLQYPHLFFEEKALFGWDCKDENVSLP